MTARTDLENAFSILDAGIKAHVSALAHAHAAVQDESYIVGLTAKVIALADQLNASNPTVIEPVVPAAVVPSAPVAPAPVAPAPVAAPVAPVVPVEAPVAPVLAPTTTVLAPTANVLAPAPVAPVAPVVAPVPAKHANFLQNMAAEIAAIQKKVL